MKYPVRVSSQVMMNAMVDANSNYPSADEIAQALNDGERWEKALKRIVKFGDKYGSTHPAVMMARRALTGDTNE